MGVVDLRRHGRISSTANRGMRRSLRKNGGLGMCREMGVVLCSASRGGWRDGRMDRWMGGWRDGGRGGWTDRWTKHRWAWTDGWAEGWVDGWEADGVHKQWLLQVTQFGGADLTIPLLQPHPPPFPSEGLPSSQPSISSRAKALQQPGRGQLCPSLHPTSAVLQTGGGVTQAPSVADVPRRARVLQGEWIRANTRLLKPCTKGIRDECQGPSHKAW